MKATLNWEHSTGKKPSAKLTLATAAAGGEVKLRATVTEASILNKGPSLEGVVLALEKPDAFHVDYHVLKRDCHFKFMNTIKVLEKPLEFTYKHEWCDKSVIHLDTTLALDNDNKVSANCTLSPEDKNKCKFKYKHHHNKGLTTLKPSYEVVHNVWDFAVSQKIYDINTLKASYKTSNQNLGLKWSLASKHNGTFKIKASLNLGEKLKVPSVVAKTTFNFEM
ncbi:hypothetical protein QN277_016216 [Acacia crassicarpa]|uniref:Uncharacterized protein n=1 Tax=Acacia crassicarpa TaxID=499986 RepID=A0AAE1TBX8_9FABA|nr:hypothetical protein QN277_016216 [Acacia crassicarpa]